MSTLELRPKRWKEDHNINRLWVPDPVILNEELKSLYADDYEGIEFVENHYYKLHFVSGFDIAPVLTWFKAQTKGNLGVDALSPRRDPAKLKLFVRRKKRELLDKDWTLLTRAEKKLILDLWEPKDIDQLARADRQP